MDEVAVLVLNHTFEPLHFTNARRAITLLLAGKAESVSGIVAVSESEIEVRDPASLDHQPDDRDQQRHREAHDQQADVRRDDRVQVVVEDEARCFGIGRAGAFVGVGGDQQRGDSYGVRASTVTTSYSVAPILT